MNIDHVNLEILQNLDLADDCDGKIFSQLDLLRLVSRARCQLLGNNIHTMGQETQDIFLRRLAVSIRKELDNRDGYVSKVLPVISHRCQRQVCEANILVTQFLNVPYGRPLRNRRLALRYISDFKKERTRKRIWSVAMCVLQSCAVAGVSVLWALLPRTHSLETLKTDKLALIYHFAIIFTDSFIWGALGCIVGALSALMSFEYLQRLRFRESSLLIFVLSLENLIMTGSAAGCLGGAVIGVYLRPWAGCIWLTAGITVTVLQVFVEYYKQVRMSLWD